MWDASLTPEVVNSPAFGLDFHCEHRVNSVIQYVDYIEMTVYYHVEGEPMTIIAESVTLTGTSTDPASAVTRQYVDDKTVDADHIEPGAVTADKLASDVDNRYVMKETPQTMQGPLTIQDKLVAQGPWEVEMWMARSARTAQSAMLTASSGVRQTLPCPAQMFRWAGLAQPDSTLSFGGNSIA
jgi:hypothetical protein